MMIKIHSKVILRKSKKKARSQAKGSAKKKNLMSLNQN